MVPLLKDVTWEDELPVAVIIPVPANTDQAPVPTVGAIAASVAVEAHTDCVIPAFDVGCAFRIMVTVEVAAVQVPLDTVHTNWFVPVLREDTAEEKLPGLVTEEVPVRTDHKPVPVVGLRAASVADVLQTVWLIPAFEVG